MNEILSVGLILLAALVAGHVAQLVRIPEVTGYLAIGLLIGPAGLDVISHDNVVTLGFLSEIALGLILFNIGSIFEISTITRVGAEAARITLWEASSALVLVSASLWLLGLEWPLAVLLGVVAMETAPATTIMVLNEYDARGPLTDRLRALVALNNTYVLVAFGLVSALLTLLGEQTGAAGAGYRAAHGLAWTTIGSISLGAVLGLVTDAWAARAQEDGEAMMLSAGVVLITVGASRWLGVSPLIATLALGATVANASRHGQRLLSALGSADPPLYAAFFVLAGAELAPSSVMSLGPAGLAYAAARTLGKLAGARVGIRGAQVPAAVRRHFGFCLISSSSLAVGLTLQIRDAFPAYAATTTAIVLAGVLIFEVVGPLLTRRALVMTGEATTMPSLLGHVAPSAS